MLTAHHTSGATTTTVGRAIGALVAAVLLVGAASVPADARAFSTGVTNIGDDSPEAFRLTRATGARFVRIPLYWAAVAPASRPASWRPEDPSDPNYDWGASDEEVTNALNAGLVPVLQIIDGPPWVQRCNPPSFSRLNTCDPDPAALEAFATAAARRYDGGGMPRVRYWQGMNEPNLSLFFNPQFASNGKPISPELYRTLINSFYRGVKSVDSSNLVVAAGLGPIAVPKYTIGPMQFTRLLLCMRGARKPRPTAGDCGGGVHFDIFAIQPYTTGGPTHKGRVNDVQLGDLPRLQRLLRAADRAGRIDGAFKRTPLWITEFSWDTRPPDPGGLRMRIATRWVAEALHVAWRAGVSHFFWYSLLDDPPSDRPSHETVESGLYFRGGSAADSRPKEIREAFRFPFVAYPGRRGLSFWGRTPTSGAGRVVIQGWTGRTWRRLGIARANKAGVFRGALHRRYGRNRKGSVRAVHRRQDSRPFAMRGVKDFRHAPLGDPVE